MVRVVSLSALDAFFFLGVDKLDEPRRHWPKAALSLGLVTT